MRKLLLTAVLAWVSVTVAVAAGWTGNPASLQGATTPVLAQAPAGAGLGQGEPAEYRAMLDQYCVGCHNERSNTPASDPVLLDTADLDNVATDAALWERVLRKLAVRAMPPQGLPRPDETEFAAFTGWLSASLDRAAAEEANPGHVVLHRLNRAEYANAIRDLLDLEVDVMALLPTDSAEFGFDNIAAVLRTSPALLERYLTAALRISTLAVGDVEAEPQAAVFNVPIEFSQNDYVEGLPLGTSGGTLVRYTFPADGRYQLSAQLVRTLDMGDVGIEGKDRPVEFAIFVDGARVHTGLIGGPELHALGAESLAFAADAVAERMRTDAFITAGTHDIGFTFIQPQGVSQQSFEAPARTSLDLHVSGGPPKLKSVTINGPFEPTGVSETPSRARIFVCQPAGSADEPACAEEILSTLARRAYRRPVTAEDLASPLDFYRDARATGDFDAGIRAGLARILASPSFVFRAEQDQPGVAPGEAHGVSELELASRLSFFLWSSIPDDELLNIAVAGRLREPGVLAGQVRRMLADARAAALAENFAGQWLGLRGIERVTADLLMFQDFDDNLRQAFRTETELFFASLIRDNRSVLDLLNADYTFVNERLARHYGIEGVYGTRFRRVQVEDPNRQGLLGHASVLALNSHATRTSPVLRGKFVLSTFLNTPPPPPPPNVPALPEGEGGSLAELTMRERMEQHRANPVCASCHRVIDPVGFALESFDPLGRWQPETPAGAPVDATGILPDGTAVSGPVELRRAITARPDAFTGIVAERLLTYALGRGLEPTDMPVVREIVAQAATDDYRFMTLISAIVESTPFQNRTVAQLRAAVE